MDDDPVQHSAAPSLARLLDLENQPPDWPADDLAALWRHLLRSPAAAEIPNCALAPAITLAQVLHHGLGGIAAFEAIKEHAKTLRAPGGALPPDIASLLYYCAIAAARAHHGSSISTLTPAALRQGLNWSLAQPWIDDATAHLLRNAEVR